MNATHRRRLLRLAEFLEQLPRKRFYYHRWVGWDWNGDKSLSCGTTACALGWAATIPSLRKAGLTLYRDGTPGSVGWRDPKTGRLTASYKLAAEKVFGLDEIGTRYLFIPSESEVEPTPKYVARKIRRFLKDRATA